MTQTKTGHPILSITSSTKNRIALSVPYATALINDQKPFFNARPVLDLTAAIIATVTFTIRFGCHAKIQVEIASLCLILINNLIDRLVMEPNFCMLIEIVSRLLRAEFLATQNLDTEPDFQRNFLGFVRLFLPFLSKLMSLFWTVST